MQRLKATLQFMQLRWLYILPALVVGFLLPRSMYANVLWDGFDSVTAFIMYVISAVLYFVLILVMGFFAVRATKVLVYVAQFQHFTDLPLIVEAWQVVRDISNMLFIVILLVIAFGTLFRLESYSWKKLLPKMIIAAILVNYSRAICGFIVDASQIVMLTFVSAIKDAATVGLVQAFQLDKLLDFGNVDTGTGGLDPESAAAESSPSQRLVAIVAAGFMLSTMFMVQCVYIVVLAGRLAMIWFLTILSPLAYVTNVLPQTEKFSSQWWEMFTRYVIVGPLCMFFLWLAMFIAAKSVDANGLGGVAGAPVEEVGFGAESVASALDPTLIAGFLIATMMLMAGLRLANENASELSQYTGKVATAATIGGGMLGIIAASKWTGGLGADAIQHRWGVDLNLQRQWEEYKHKRHEQKQNRFNKGYQKAAARAERGDLLAWTGAAGYMGEHFAPFVGEIGMIKYLLRKFPGAGTNAKVDKKMKERQELEKKVAGHQETLDGHMAPLNNLMDEETRQAALLDLQEREDEIFTRPDTGNKFDTRKEEDREILQSHAGNLQKQIEAAKTAGDAPKVAQLMAAFNQLQMALQTKGEVEVKMSAADKTAATAGALDAIKKEKDALTPDRSLNGAIKDRATLNDLLANQTVPEGATLSTEQRAALDGVKAEREAIAKLNETIKGLTDYIQHSRLPADADRMIKQRRVSADILKDVISDSEEYLMDRIKTFEHHKDMTGVMAIAEYMSKVGHDNEIPRAFGFAASPEGMRAWADQMKEKGVDEQWLYNVMMQISQNAQANNHWQMAQMIGVKDGRLYMRDQREQAEAMRIEAEKAGVSNILRNGNRLAWGEYTEQGNKGYKMLPGMAAMLAESLHTLTDTIRTKGLVNTNFAAHAALPDVDQRMRQLINQTQKNEDDRRTAMANWDHIVRLGSTKPLDESGSVGAAIAASIRRAEKIIPTASRDDINKGSTAGH